MNVLAIGASRGVGYYATIRLLEKGATVTFLLRSPAVFNSDAAIQRHVQSGHARIVQGDALVPEDVTRAWAAAQEGPGNHVDLVLFTVGGTPSFNLFKGAVITPPDLCTRALLTVLRTLPSSHRPTSSQPKIIVISSTGVTRASHKRLPLIMRPLYSLLLHPPHADKLGMERVMAFCGGWEWRDREPAAEVLPGGWRDVAGTPLEGQLKRLLVVRAAMFTDGECRGDAQSGDSARKVPYRVGEGDLENNGYTVSRKDVAHFIVEGALEEWSLWDGKVMTIAY